MAQKEMLNKGKSHAYAWSKEALWVARRDTEESETAENSMDERCEKLAGAGLVSLFVGWDPSRFPERCACEGFPSTQRVASASKHAAQFCGGDVFRCG